MTYDDRDLDDLLRQQSERLAPPDGSWDLVIKRARRRKWAKASVSVTAGLIIVAGAVPAVIAVRHNPTNAKGSISILTPSSGHTGVPHSTNSSVPAPASSPPTTISLAGFVPESSTFISPDEGFLIGPGATPAVVAKTIDGGQSWSAISSPPVDGANVGIRFAHADNGYIFGRQYYVTADGGSTWQKYASPGRIHDLETMNDRIWATVTTSQSPHSIQLWEGTVADPVLHPVAKVPAITGDDSTLVLSTSAVYLMVHDSATQQGQLWASPNGVSWAQRADPCNGVSLGTFATWSTNGLAAVCFNGAASTTPSQVFESANHARSWQPRGHVPISNPDMISAGSPDALVVTQGGTGGEPYVSTNGGQHFTAVKTGTASMGFVGFISPLHVVALSSELGQDHAFISSTDGGLTWIAYPFAK